MATTIDELCSGTDFRATSFARGGKRNKVITDVDVWVALEGLKVADHLSKGISSSGHTVALQMYRKNLALLMTVLANRYSSNVQVSYDMSVLADHVKTAIYDAERLQKSTGGRRLFNNSTNIVATDITPTRQPFTSTKKPEVETQERSLTRFKGTTEVNKMNIGSLHLPHTNSLPMKSHYYTPPAIDNGHSRRTNDNTFESNNTKNSTSNDKEDTLTQTVRDEMWTSPERNSVCWSDVAGLEKAKRALQEAVILPLIRPDLYTGLRTAPKGILLYGPPGTGKTLLAKAAAHEGKCSFFACSPSTLTSKWMGEGEKLLRALFRLARDESPSIVFFDEIDSLLSKRKTDEHEATRRFKTEFMVQVDGVVASPSSSSPSSSPQKGKSDHVLVLGCTNCPWDLDDAVLRRFQRRIHVPLPDESTRAVLLRDMLDQNKHSLSEKEIMQVVKQTGGCSCSDLKSIANEASFGPLRSLGSMEQIRDTEFQDVRPINASDYADAVQNLGKTVSDSLLKRYDQWQEDSAAR